MNYIGLLPEDTARKEIAKLLKLIGILSELRNRVPASETEETCLPFQRQAVRNEIRTTMAYLRRWKVPVKAIIKEK